MLRNLGNVVYDEVTAAKGTENLKENNTHPSFTQESASGKLGRSRRFT